MITHTSPTIYSEKARDSLQLEQFRATDFSSMAREISAIFTHTQDLSLRYLPLARKIAQDSAASYPKAPQREMSGINPAVELKLRAIYRELGVDAFLGEMEQAGALQNAYIIGVFPTGNRLTLMGFLPYQVIDITFGDPFAQARGDLRDADSVTLSIPIRPPASTGLSAEWTTANPLYVALLHISRTTAYLQYPDGARVGVYSPDQSNPLGYIPLVGTRRVQPPQSSSYLPPIAEDVRSVQIGVNVAVSDFESIIRDAALPLIVAKGTMAGNIKDAPKRIGSLLTVPGDVDLQVVQTNPPIALYIQAIETTIHYLTSWRNTRPEAFSGSIVATGAARLVDQLGFQEERQRQENRLQVLEANLMALIVDVHNATIGGALSLVTPELSVRFRYLRPDQNKLQEAQSLAVLASLGLSDVVETVAQEEGLTEAQAEDKIIKRLERRKRLFADAGDAEGPSKATPGLDKSVPT